MKTESIAKGLCAVAGILDFTTGSGLVALPNFTLRAMGAPPVGPEGAVFLRFVGAFVAAVGATYLWALLRGGRTRLTGVLEFTILFRLAAGGYSAFALGSGLLDLSWVSVPATDFALVALQAWLLWRLGKEA
jgi:hypothetical protein